MRREAGEAPTFNGVSVLHRVTSLEHLSLVEFSGEYSVIHISIPPIKGLCSKIAPGEVGVSLP